MATVDSSKKSWYTLKAISGKELKTKEAIEAEVKRRGVENLMGEVVVPLEKVYQERNGKKVCKEHVLFSGYVFVECHLNKEMQAILSSVQNVLGFLTYEVVDYREDGRGVKKKVGTRQEPMPMRADEVSRMIGRVDEASDDTVEEVSPFALGEKVKVTDGSFSGFSGEIEEINEDKKKLTVNIAIFGRKTPLELSYSQVVKED